MADIDLSRLGETLRRYDIVVREEFHLPILGDRRQVAVRRVARERWGPRFAFRVSQHPSQVIGYVREGRGEMLDAERNIVSLAPGTVFALGGGAHRSIAAEGVGLRVSLVVCAPGAAADLVRHFWGSTNVMLTGRPGLTLATLFDAILDAARGGGEFAGEICRHYVEILVRSAAPVSGTGDSGARATFRRCLSLFADGQATPSQAANDAGISVAYLCRLFQRFAAQTPGAYRDRQRAARAEDLLADTDLPLGEVAERLGYPDAFAFSRAFKRFTGLAPKHWRETRR